MNNKISFGIVGSGTAGLVAALMLRKTFIDAQITIISSSQIGIIGVGEGSTEHWRQFMEYCNIPTEELIINSSATHKNGIRFENWTNHTPDYFHSVGGIDEIFANGLYASYMGMIEAGNLITSQTSSVGLITNKISRRDIHKTVNQFHFDTNQLNDYLSGLCFNRMIKFVDGTVKSVNIDSEDGSVVSVVTDSEATIEADFWIDATGFSRIIMNSLQNTKWESFSSYLLTDSAIAFPTESDPNGQIRPYTRARASSSGWMWEIPTQERRGNGHVFSSAHTFVDEAIREAELISGYKVVDNPRTFKFDAGYLKNQWTKNCVAVGLASAFVEPLEATSIGSTIIQMKFLMQNIASYNKNSEKMQASYNKTIEQTMRNILTMIRLHYISDRRDSEFWIDQANMPVNEELQELIDVWSERSPSRYDNVNQGHFMFQTPHLAHVMQGQGLIPKEPSAIALDRLGIRDIVNHEIDKMRNSRHGHELVDHRVGLMEIELIDREFDNGI
jgi:tryptophan halogenase